MGGAATDSENRPLERPATAAVTAGRTGGWASWLGDRRVWLAGGAVLLTACAIILASLAEPRERLTGGNGVGVRGDLAALTPGEPPRGDVATVSPGHRLCVSDLTIPDGTAGVRLVAFPRGAGSTLEVSLRTAAGSRSGSARPAGRKGRVDVRFAELSLDRETVPARLCVASPAGEAGIGGTAGVPGGEQPPTVGGEPIQAQVALWYLGANDSSLLSRLPDAIRRAALLRPAAVSPWWYAVALLAVVPLLWLVALRMLATAAAGRGPGRRTGLGIAAIAVVNAALWALLTPAFHGPDEPDHFAFTQALAETGEAPDKAPGSRSPYSSEARLALDAVRSSSLGCPPYLLQRPCLSDVRPPWLTGDRERWERRLATAGARRDDGGGFSHQASPHGPGYYALTVPGYLAADDDDTFAQLTLARLISALLAGVTAACAFLTVRELSPRNGWLGVVAGLLVAFQPQFAFVAGTVNNDNGVNAAAAVLLLLLIRGLRRGLTVTSAAALGGALVAVHVTKGTGSALYPAAIVGIAGMAWRHGLWRQRRALGAMAGVAVGLQALWALGAPAFGTRPFTTAGGSVGPGLAGLVERVLEQPSAFLSYAWQVFLPRLPSMTDLLAPTWPAYDIYVVGGWAAFGQLSVRFPGWVYAIVLAVSLATAVGCALAVARNRPAARSRGWELAVLLIALGGVVAGIEVSQFAPGGRLVPGEQGRYLFTAIVPLAAIAAGGCLALGRRRAPVAGAALVAAVMGLCYASQILTLTWLFS